MLLTAANLFSLSLWRSVRHRLWSSVLSSYVNFTWRLRRLRLTMATDTPATPVLHIHRRNRATSTPVPEYSDAGTRNLNDLNVSPLHMDGDVDVMTCSLTSTDSGQHEDLEPGHISVPIQGYEVMEERSRFSVFKIQVGMGPADTWFIFRRYSDFDHLNNKLGEIFPHFRLSLPPKKWFGDNFDKNFLEDRMIGLQAFLNNIVGNKEVCNSEPVREFFCFDDPPGPYDSLEECRAMCECLEEKMCDMHDCLAERDSHIELLQEELRLSKLQIDNLRKALKTECILYTDTQVASHRLHADHIINLVLLDLMDRSTSRPPSVSSIPEESIDQHTRAEAKVCTPDMDVSLTSSLTSTAETIRLSSVPAPAPPTGHTAPPTGNLGDDSDDASPAPRTKKKKVPTAKTTGNKSSGTKSSGPSVTKPSVVASGTHITQSSKLHDVTSDYCSNSSDPGSSDVTTGGSYLSCDDTKRDLTGPGAATQDRVGSATCTAPPGDANSAPSSLHTGAHSVDGRQRKRPSDIAPTLHDAKTNNNLDKADKTGSTDSCNNNQVLLI